jgi:hypothetical protein
MKRNKGFTLLIAVVTTSLMLLVSFVVLNVALKQLILSHSNQESQYAFYAADSGIGCAVYWDSQSPTHFSPGEPASFIQTFISEYSGIDTSSPLDKVSSNTGEAEGGSENIDSGSKATLFSNELIFGHIDINYGAITPGAGFSSIGTEFGNLEEYKVVNSIGTYSVTASIDPAYVGADWIAFMATFKAASGQTPALVQNYAKYVAPSNGGQYVDFSDTSTSGDLIIVQLTYDSTADISSMTDNKGNTYIRAIGPVFYPSDEFRSELWYAKNIRNQSLDGTSPTSEPIRIFFESQLFGAEGISCNGQNIPAGESATDDVQTIPPQPSEIGGNPSSIFQLNFPKGCAIVTVTKTYSPNTTTIESRGYNTCDTSSLRRFERAIRVTY